MELIINCPTDKLGIKEFNIAFAKVQKELVLHSIKSLNMDINKEKILRKIAAEIKKQVEERRD